MRPLNSLLILVAEDSKDNQELVRNALENAGATVETANNGTEAFDIASKGQHDLVLMDIQMPEINGLEATARLRQIGFSKPIIALTALSHIEDRARSLAAGCDAHLTKPFDINILISTILKLILQK